MKKVLVLIAVLSLAVAGVAFANIDNSKHDMVIEGVTGTTQICVFCHHPHRGDQGGADATVLWNYNAAGTTFTTYGSPGMSASDAGDNLGTTGDAMYSFACMGCHDGDTAGDSLYVQPSDAGGNTVDLTNISDDMTSANLGTDLGDDHPVDFTYTQDGGLKDKNVATDAVDGASGISYPLFSGSMQCATCHNVHNAESESIGGAGIQFMRMDTSSGNTLTDSAICTDCHTNK